MNASMHLGPVESGAICLKKAQSTNVSSQPHRRIVSFKQAKHQSSGSSLHPRNSMEASADENTSKANLKTHSSTLDSSELHKMLIRSNAHQPPYQPPRFVSRNNSIALNAGSGSGLPLPIERSDTGPLPGLSHHGVN